jgi:ribosomal protein S18 acetylase RimI-like enzyme
VRLRPMTVAEFDRFLTSSIAGYAQEHVASGDWSENDGQRLARSETEALLPQGLATPGMLFLVAEADGATRVGAAWLALEQSDKRGAWIYDIEVEPELRGKGYGSALLEALERTVADHGGEEIGLNVFAGNAVARRLYERSGYETTSLHMRKSLSS